MSNAKAIRYWAGQKTAKEFAQAVKENCGPDAPDGALLLALFAEKEMHLPFINLISGSREAPDLKTLPDDMRATAVEYTECFNAALEKPGQRALTRRLLICIAPGTLLGAVVGGYAASKMTGWMPLEKRIPTIGMGGALGAHAGALSSMILLRERALTNMILRGLEKPQQVTAQEMISDACGFTHALYEKEVFGHAR